MLYTGVAGLQGFVILDCGAGSIAMEGAPKDTVWCQEMDNGVC